MTAWNGRSSAPDHCCAGHRHWFDAGSRGVPDVRSGATRWRHDRRLRPLHDLRAGRTVPRLSGDRGRGQRRVARSAGRSGVVRRDRGRRRQRTRCGDTTERFVGRNQHRHDRPDRSDGEQHRQLRGGRGAPDVRPLPVVLPPPRADHRGAVSEHPVGAAIGCVDRVAGCGPCWLSALPSCCLPRCSRCSHGHRRAAT